MSKNLFASDSESENYEDTEIKLNNEYAKSYNKFRQKEFVQKLKAQDLKNFNSSSSEDSDSTDEEDDIINAKFDEEFFKTLSSLKNKNPEIYDKNVKFFQNISDDDDNDDDNKIISMERKKKPLTLKDYERNIIVEKGGKFEDDSDSDNGAPPVRTESPSYFDEQRKLQDELRNAIKSDNDSADEEFGGIFKKRRKTKEEKSEEETEYVTWLAGQRDDISEEAKKTLKPLKEFWNKPDLPKHEKFLRDYVLNKGYIDANDDEIPTYDEIIGDDLSEDEKDLERMEEFEQKYNFRYEDPDQEFIKRYPRTIDNSVRKDDDSRKRKRLETKERKQNEKNEKMKQIEILKELKRNEIMEKIQKLKEVTGNEELPFKEEELEEDFDPDAHDRKMKEIFSESYYQEDEDAEKPECPDIEELQFEDWDNFDPTKNSDNNTEANCEDEDFIMDCDYLDNKEKFQNELIDNTKRRGRKRRNRFLEAIKKEKPVFNPDNDMPYEDYLDEYYKLDCEDMIGDMPCRFKYVDCVPNDFGLTIEEILLAKNKELNQWASLKKAVQIRPEHVERNEARLFMKKAENLELKKKIFQSIYGDQESDSEDGNAREDISSKTKNTQSKSNKISEIRKKKSLDLEQNNETFESEKDDKNKTLQSEKIIVNDPILKAENNKIHNMDGHKKKKKNNTVTSNVQLKKELEQTTPSNIALNTPNIKTPKNKNTNNPFNSKQNISEKFTKNKIIEKSYSKNKGKDSKKILFNQSNMKKLNNKTQKNPFNSRETISKKPIENKNLKKANSDREGNDDKESNSLQNNNDVIRTKKNRKFNKRNVNTDKTLSDERLKAYGINPKKFNKKQNFLKFNKNKVRKEKFKKS